MLMASTPARSAKTPKPIEVDEYDDIELIGEIDTSDESFTAKVFSEAEFTFSTDINGFLLLTATRGGDEFIRLMDSLVIVDISDTRSKKEIGARTEAEKTRFHDVLSTQKHLTIERLAKFVGDLMDIAGNEDGETSPAD